MVCKINATTSWLDGVGDLPFFMGVWGPTGGVGDLPVLMWFLGCKGN